MVEIGDHSSLGQIRFRILGLRDQPGVRHVDGDGPVQLLILSEIDKAKAPLAEHFLNAVATDPLGIFGRWSTTSAGQLSLRDPPSHRVYCICSRLPSPCLTLCPHAHFRHLSIKSEVLAIWIWECITHPQFEPQNDVSFAESRGQRKTPGLAGPTAPLLNGFCAYRSQDRSGIARGSLGTGLPV